MNDQQRYGQQHDPYGQNDPHGHQAPYGPYGQGGEPGQPDPHGPHGTYGPFGQAGPYDMGHSQNPYAAYGQGQGHGHGQSGQSPQYTPGPHEQQPYTPLHNPQDGYGGFDATYGMPPQPAPGAWDFQQQPHFEAAEPPPQPYPHQPAPTEEPPEHGEQPQDHSAPQPGPQPESQGGAGHHPDPRRSDPAVVTHRQAPTAGPLPPEQRTSSEPRPAPQPPEAVPESAPPERPAARTGSPLIAPGLRPALVTSVLAALLALAAPLGQIPLACAVVVLQAVTAAGWFRLNGMWPARQGIALAFLGGVVTDAGLVLAGTDRAPTVVVSTLGVWCVLNVVLHLRNHSEPDERLYALTAAITSTALTVLAAGHLLAAPEAVTVGAGGAAIAALSRSVLQTPYLSPAVALVAAAGGGVALGGAAGLGAAGGLLGLAAGGCALIGLRVASYDFPSRFVHMTAGVALPLTFAAPAVYLLGRALS